MTKSSPLYALLALTACTLAAVAASASDPQPASWPRFRGPNGDGISPATGVLKSWPEGSPEVLWKVALGGGFSGLAIVDGRIYTSFSREGDELTAAFDAKDGRQIWQARLDRERKDSYGDGPRSTPLVDGGLVYAVSALGKLYALAVKTGATVWYHDLPEEFGGRVPDWGVSASPLVEGDLLLFDVGGSPGHSIMAFNKKTGAVVWSAETDAAGYSTPIALSVAGLRQVVFFTGTMVLGLAPRDGKVLWKQTWKTSLSGNAATPVFVPSDRLFISSGNDTGAALFKLAVHGGAVDVTTVWRSREMNNQFSSSVHVDGHIYGFDGGTLKCLAADTGEVKWRKRGLGHGSLFYADGHLVALGDGGQLALLVASASAYQEIAHAEVMAGRHWTVPTLYGGRLYIRNETDLVCLKFAE